MTDDRDGCIGSNQTEGVPHHTSGDGHGQCGLRGTDRLYPSVCPDPAHDHRCRDPDDDRIRPDLLHSGSDGRRSGGAQKNARLRCDIRKTRDGKSALGPAAVHFELPFVPVCRMGHDRGYYGRRGRVVFDKRGVDDPADHDRDRRLLQTRQRAAQGGADGACRKTQGRFEKLKGVTPVFVSALHDVEDIEGLGDVIKGAVVLLVIEGDAVEGAGLDEFRVFDAPFRIACRDDLFVLAHRADMALKRDELPQMAELEGDVVRDQRFRSPAEIHEIGVVFEIGVIGRVFAQLFDLPGGEPVHGQGVGVDGVF